MFLATVEVINYKIFRPSGVTSHVILIITIEWKFHN